MSGSAMAWDESRSTAAGGPPNKPGRIPLDELVEGVAGTAPLSDFELYSGRGLAADACFVRVVRLLDLARAAEVQGRPRRAEFFWGEAYRALRTATLTEEGRLRLARDGFWETHWALIRGALLHGPADAIGPGARAFEHARHIQAMSDLLPAESEAMREDLEAVLRSKMESLERAGRLDEAWDAARELHRLVPEESSYLSRAAALQLQMVSRATSDGKRHEEALRSAIGRLNTLRDEGRPHLPVLHAEAQLRDALAVRLANTGHVSEALVECQRALSLDPHLADGEETWKKLIDLMGSLKEQMARVTEALKLGNRHLTTEGANLMLDATRGFDPVEAFLNSEERSGIAQQRKRALASHIARDADLDGIAPEDPRLSALLDATTEVMEHPPAEADGVEAGWREAVKRHPDLESIDARAMAAFLRRRLFAKDGEAPVRKVREPRLRQGPALQVASRAAARDGEPFKAWLYGPGDLRIKAQCALAATLVVVALGIGARERIHRNVRASAYAAAFAASDREDLAGLMNACAEFLRSGIVASDPREAEMIRLYDQAMVQWILRDAPPGEELRRRTDERRVLLPESRRLQ